MTTETSETTVEVLGKTYQFKCPTDEISALQAAAKILHQKMSELRAANRALSLDRIAVLAALNMSYLLLTNEHNKDALSEAVNDRLQVLHNTIEQALLNSTALEFHSAK